MFAKTKFAVTPELSRRQKGMLSSGNMAENTQGDLKATVYANSFTYLAGYHLQEVYK